MNYYTPKLAIFNRKGKNYTEGRSKFQRTEPKAAVSHSQEVQLSPNQGLARVSHLP